MTRAPCQAAPPRALLIAMVVMTVSSCSTGDPAPVATVTVTQAVTVAPASNAWPERLTFPFAQGASPSADFPPRLPGMALEDSWADTPRAFTGETWTALGGPDGESFPSTMNGCDNQRFLVRWRAVNEQAQVAARWGQSGVEFGEPVVANAGWFDVDGCARPEFRMASKAGESTLTDLTVRVQRWVPAP